MKEESQPIANITKPFGGDTDAVLLSHPSSIRVEANTKEIQNIFLNFDIIKPLKWSNDTHEV